MKILIWTVLIAVGWTTGLAAAQTAGEAPAGAAVGPLVVHFDKNRAELSALDKTRLRSLLQRYDLAADSRVFVVGYTDAAGAKAYNDSLSFRRAQAVRRAVMEAGGLPGEKVIAVGRGAESPLAANGDAKKRVRNRRAEIYLTHVAAQRAGTRSALGERELAAVKGLVVEAQTLLRQRRLTEALHKLQQAGAAGGDQSSVWHCVYAMTGFYANAPATKVRVHLLAALQLDPYNEDAREYLGRLEAREKVAAGEVTAQMGRTPAQAIAIIDSAQAYEYLHLFGVTPMARQALISGALEAWECSDARGRSLVYYFDRARVYDWAFAAAQPPAAEDMPGLQGRLSAPAGSAEAATPTPAPQRHSLSRAGKIWQSQLFQ